MTQFIGRTEELKRLQRLLKKKSASLIVVKGRRRIGKSRLLREFGQSVPNRYFFSGLPPTPHTTAQTQREEFASQLNRELGIKGLAANDWSDLFWHLAKRTQTDCHLIVLDEITWMGAKDSDFLGKIKTAWDLYFSHNPKLILVLCGSMSAWIEKNILSNTGFLGRESLTLTLRELPLCVCKAFWTQHNIDVSPYEMLKVLAVTGGVPRYLEEIDPHLSAEENIKQLCFEEGSILFNEFDKIFSDLFQKRNARYQQITQLLVSGPRSQKEIANNLGYKTQTDVGQYLDDLIKSGFISRDYTWKIKSAKESSLSRYRLTDNYARFYLKYILPNKNKIIRGSFANISLSTLPGWSTIMGLQVENLILNNRQIIKKLLNIPSADIVMDNPYLQTTTSRRAGCQIDYLIQTQFNTLYVCEIKFSRNTIGLNIINDVKEKIYRLELPKNFFCRPVLIHASDVSDKVSDSNYFTNTIDVADLFTVTQ